MLDVVGWRVLTYSNRDEHGNAVKGSKGTRPPAQMKAVCQNLTQSNMRITDGIYGWLFGDDGIEIDH